MAIAQSVKARLKMSSGELAVRPPIRFGWHDVGMFVVIGLAVLMAFGPAAWRQRWRRVYQIGLIVYVGFVSGDLLAQKLFAGWARSGIPWTTAPGLALLAAAALLVPWASRRPLYCHHICPHGAAQELLGRWRPKSWRLHLRPDVARGLETAPALLLLFVIVVTMFAVPFDLAGIEPFDAYLVRTAGIATVAVAVVGLIASLFVPQAYCRFGCPTGALLQFVRGRGAEDRFSRRDGVALIYVIIAVVLNWKFLTFLFWLRGAS
jgi:polyferredoxin